MPKLNQINALVSARKGDAEKAVTAYHTQRGVGSPCPLASCPWCGDRLSADSVRVERVKSASPGRSNIRRNCRK